MQSEDLTVMYVDASFHLHQIFKFFFKRIKSLSHGLKNHRSDFINEIYSNYCAKDPKHLKSQKQFQASLCYS